MRSIRVRPLRHHPVFILFAAWLCMACSADEPPELRQGAAVVRYMIAPNQLRRSMFSAAYPDPRPSDYVSYLFSTMGAAEWPAPARFSSPEEIEQMRAIGMPMPPEDVTYLPDQPDPGRGKQIVIRADDVRGVVILEGYLDPQGAPALRQELTLRRTPPDPIVESIYQSNLQMGMSPQSSE